VVAVQVGEASLVPAAGLLRLARRAGASGEGLVDQLVYLLAPLQAEDQDRLVCSLMITDAMSSVMPKNWKPRPVKKACDRARSLTAMLTNSFVAI
jgi:hypothetical protein